MRGHVRSFLRRGAQRGRRVLARQRRQVVRVVGADAFEVAGKVLRVDDPEATFRVAGTVRLDLPEAASLVVLAAADLLEGDVYRLQVRIRRVPEWGVVGLRPPPIARSLASCRWSYRRNELTVDLAWCDAEPVRQALSQALKLTTRARAWDQTSGPVYAMDRQAWLRGATTWPQGWLGSAATNLDGQQRPLGPYGVCERPALTASPSIVTAVANPYGRRLVGNAARYHLVPASTGLALTGEDGRTLLRFDRTVPPEGAIGSSGISRYAVVTPKRLRLTDSADAYTVRVLRSLAACGVVFSADAVARAQLEAWDLVVVDDPNDVADLPGYRLSTLASRRMAIAADPALRRTALGGGSMPLPTVSVLLCSMRPELIERCLQFLAQQTYPAVEVLVGLHGYEVPDSTGKRWQAQVPFPLRVQTLAAELTLGAALGRLSRVADGELLAKVDDDDHYGRDHVTDLVISWHTLGADLAAKGARFVYLPEADQTLDRVWAAPEGFNVTPAGGGLLISRSALQQVGGWSHSSKHVDEDLLIRLRDRGGLVYRTHALEYVYVRRSSGHTFVTDMERLLVEGKTTYPGLPRTILETPAHTSG